MVVVGDWEPSPPRRFSYNVLTPDETEENFFHILSEFYKILKYFLYIQISFDGNSRNFFKIVSCYFE